MAVLILNTQQHLHGFHLKIPGARKVTRVAVPWLRQLVAGLSTRRPGFDPSSVHVGFVVDKVALGQVSTQSTSVFICQFHSTGAPLHGKTKKLIIFITGLHNKPQGCGTSVASAAVSFTTKKKVTRRNFDTNGTLILVSTLPKLVARDLCTPGLLALVLRRHKNVLISLSNTDLMLSKIYVYSLKTYPVFNMKIINIIYEIFFLLVKIRFD
jgi:hypothetical protein